MKQSLWYMASVYTQYPKGLEEAYIEASKAAAVLLKRGMNIFSPIAHSHPIAVHGALDAVDHDFWMRLDKAILDECDGLLVVMMPGWRDSRGIAAEIKHAKEGGKPISFLSWPMLEERENESI